MARIRTVKPELWTDPEFTECSMSARLLFIASLNFASDFGVLPDKPRQLKMQCLPAESIDAEPLVTELIQHGFYVRRVAPNGDKVLVIRTFVTHQKINRPSQGRWGDPQEWDETPPDSPPPHGDISEESEHLTEAHPPEGKGRDNSEGKGNLSSSQSVTHLALVPAVDKPDDDDTVRFNAAVDHIVDARCEGRHFKTSEVGYRATVRAEAEERDGALIRRMLADGDHPRAVALFVLGHGLATASEAQRQPIPWCDKDCPTCGGDAWIEADTGGLTECPERIARTA